MVSSEKAWRGERLKEHIKGISTRSVMCYFFKRKEKVRSNYRKLVMFCTVTTLVFVGKTCSFSHLKFFHIKKVHYGASLVVQWLRICLPMQGTRVRALVWEDPTCRRATKPVSHNYWACASGACAPQQERLWQWEARAPRWRVAPACHNYRKPSQRNEDPTQPKIN